MPNAVARCYRVKVHWHLENPIITLAAGGVGSRGTL